jgi:hypothetical protein
MAEEIKSQFNGVIPFFFSLYCIVYSSMFNEMRDNVINVLSQSKFTSYFIKRCSTLRFR